MRTFASWLVGLPVEQPAAYRRLRSIRERIWRRIAPLEVAMLTSPEPTPFGQWTPEDFRPVRPGTAWGGALSCAWLRITGAPATDPRAQVLLGIRGEGLVHDAAGTPIDSVTTVFLQGDLPHASGRHRPIANVDVTQPIELYADVAHNGVLLYPVGTGVVHGAHLAVRDDEAFALYHDTLTLVVLAGHTDDAALRRDLRRALDASWARVRSGDVAGARAELAPALAAPSTSELTYTGVGHGHLDMAWLWPLRETRRKAARTYVRALNAVDRRDGYVYGTSQPQQMQWMRDEQPALFARLRDAVAAGRVELQGSFWVEPDTNLPSGESLIRQAIVGRRFLQREFGLADDDLRLCWLPDTFGYSGNLPQILRGTGMDWFQTIKLAWNTVTVFPHRTFRWQGIDGSEVLVHMPPEGDYNSRAAADGLLRGERQHPERDLGTALLVYGGGDGGGGPSELHHELLAREAREGGMRGLPKVELGGAVGFFRHLETLEITDEHRGELYLETHQGTYTTQAATKRWNRVVERLLHETEALAAMHGPAARVAERDALEPIWQELLLQQFHDILPGSSITRVHRESEATFARLAGLLEARIAALVDAVPADGDALTAINLSPVARDEAVRIDASGDGDGTGAAGGRWMRARVAGHAAATLVAEPEHPELASDERGMTNGLLTLRFDDASGEITSCVDADGREHAGGGLNRLVLHRDPYQVPFDAWDMSAKALRATPRTLRVRDAAWRVDGPRAERTHVLEGPKVRIQQTIVLEAGSPLVRFETHVDWRQRHRMLRTEHRPSRYGDEAICEIQMGHIRRPTTERDAAETAQLEVCAHRWLAVEDAEGGFALLNDGKYGHRAKLGLVSLNLLRSPTFPDRTADRGEHRFTYAVRPFATGALHEVIADGYRMATPLRLARGRAFDSLVEVDDPGVVVETIAPAFASDGTVVRLYEALGRSTTTRLTARIPHRGATRTDMLERHGDAQPVDLDRLRLEPFEIVTLVLEA